VKKYKGKMPLDTWKMLIKQIRDLGYQLEQLQIHGNGEPLLNKDIVEMISRANPIAKKIRLTTNGTKLTPTMTRNLIEAGVDEIWVSLDSADPREYELFKGKDACDLVKLNIYASSIIVEDMGASLVIKYPLTKQGWPYDITKKYKESVDLEFGPLAEGNKTVHLVGMPVVVMTGGKKIYTTPCEIPFYSLFVKYDGRVSLCCADFRNDLTVGNIHSGPLGEIIKGSELSWRRRDHLDGSFLESPMCSRCGNRTCVDLTDIKDEVRKLI
jgi:MoaA/NifB/PqqE/SkfB family radical SAM enzyme